MKWQAYPILAGIVFRFRSWHKMSSVPEDVVSTLSSIVPVLHKIVLGLQEILHFQPLEHVPATYVSVAQTLTNPRKAVSVKDMPTLLPMI